MRFTGFNLNRSRTNSSERSLRKHTPWIASPLANDQESASHLLHTYDSHGSSSYEENDKPVFQHHHESSTVELFYDLFFVANLATFTINHEMNNGEAVKNYVGFFALLWTTWLQTSLFDVRFASDSVFNRFCKAVSFAVMMGFAVSGSLYDTENVSANVKAFRAMALILMVSRLTLVVQYGVVLSYVRNYHKVYAPLLATMAVLFIAAMIYLGTAFGFPVDYENQPRTYIAWYVVAAVEATAVVIISSIWRIVSFKHTHLVERIGLLTLIIMGEGLFGTTKAVSKILQTSSKTSGRDIGIIAATILLVYFIWVLYFDQIEHDRFGTIRQQIWALLHFPLHVAILLTVEGASNLVIWNIVAPFQEKWLGLQPLVVNATGTSVNPRVFESPESVADYCDNSIAALASVYKAEKKLTAYYDYKQNITFIRNVTLDAFHTDEGFNSVLDTVENLWVGVYNAIFESFGVEVPESESKGGSPASGTFESFAEQTQKFLLLIVTVAKYYYIAAGCMLVMLAVLYAFGKSRKNWQEWTTIGVRTFFGACLTFVIAIIVGLARNNRDNPAVLKGIDNFIYSPWHIPMVTLVFFIVIVLDNVLVWHTNRTITRQTLAEYSKDAENPNPAEPSQKDAFLSPETSHSDSNNGHYLGH